MTHEITGYDEQIENEQIKDKQTENEQLGDKGAPPLCLVHYFAEAAAYPPERNPKPPGDKRVGRIAERRGNLIILEFAPPPETAQAKWQKKRRSERIQSRISMPIFLLLLLLCFIGCLAAVRF